MGDKKKILALDDQKSMRNMLGFVLKSDFDVTVVGHSSDAIREAKGGGFDLVLLDINLDNDTMDGIAVAEELQGAGIDTPVAFLSSLTFDSLDAGSHERAGALRNVKFYQTKPMQPAVLIEKIKKVVG